MTTTTTRASIWLVWAGAALLLLAPAVAMRFTPEVRWTARDFATAAVLLASVAGAFTIAARRATGWAYRAGAGLALLTALVLVWVNLAVGIIGSENNDANLMYAGVLAVAVGGSITARFTPRGMAVALGATAAAQVAVAAIALTFGLGAEGVNWPGDVLGATALLTAMWLTAAALFRRAEADAR